MNRRERLRRSLRAEQLAGDDPRRAGLAWKFNGRDVRLQDLLIARRCHLRPRRQVDPQLHHLERATTPREIALVELLVDDTRSRRHPLDVTRTYLAVVASRVAML